MSDTAEALAGRPVGRMTEAEYERERARQRDLYGDSSAEASAKRDQGLALLFARSGWTQEELAQKEGKSQTHIAKALRFGRFLNFSSMELNPEGPLSDLNERRFRAYWDRTERLAGSNGHNERVRFTKIREMIENPTLRSLTRKPIGPAIVERFADGEWHHLKDIAEAVGDGDEKFVAKTLENIIYPHARLDAKAERRQHGRSHEYRIFKDAATKVVSLEELRTKLRPIIKGLLAEGKKNMVTMSPGAVLHYASQLDRQLKEWTK